MLCCAILFNLYSIGGYITVDQFLAKFGDSLPKFDCHMTTMTKGKEDDDDDNGGDGIDHNLCAMHCSHRKQAKQQQRAADGENDVEASSSDSVGGNGAGAAVTTSTSTSTSNPAGIPSFYQRKLPETCVAFASPGGKKIFRSALQRGGLKSFYNLIEQHHTQTEPAFCGISTLVLVLNALAVDPGQKWKGPWRWYEEKMLNCCVDLETIKQSGITLPDFQCLAFCQGLSVEVRYCDESSSLEDFRATVARACVEDDGVAGGGDGDGGEDGSRQKLECLVVSYSRKVLQQTGDGHFSPLAAYDEESDSVLILDTARFKYGAHWTKLPLLYEAMKPVDKTTGKSRGYALLSFDHQLHEAAAMALASMTTTTALPATLPSEPSSSAEAGTTTVSSTTSPLSTQPASILYRSMMNQNRKRRRYKDYIRSLREQPDGAYRSGDIPYELVRSYWYEGDDGDGGDPSSVWEIIVPTRVRTVEEKELLRKMRLLLADLHRSVAAGVGGGDGDGTDATTATTTETYHPSMSDDPAVSITAEETVTVIYLATLSRDRRYEAVVNCGSTTETTDAGDVVVVRNQILGEADMIASAIEVSDKLTSL